jgi:hypothetical protein
MDSAYTSIQELIRSMVELVRHCIRPTVKPGNGLISDLVHKSVQGREAARLPIYGSIRLQHIRSITSHVAHLSSRLLLCNRRGNNKLTDGGMPNLSGQSGVSWRLVLRVRHRPVRSRYPTVRMCPGYRVMNEVLVISSRSLSGSCKLAGRGCFSTHTIN